VAAVALRNALLERERELAELVEVLASARVGDGSLMLIEGPAGVGKTRLIAAAREFAINEGMEVLAARGGELERSFSYGVVRQLFETPLAAARPKERQDLLAGTAALARPALGLEAVGEVASDQRFAAIHGLYWLTSNLAARGPLLIAVDDAHWSDTPSLEWLAYLARRVADLPVALLVAARPRELGVENETLEALAADDTTRSVHPRPLSESAVREMVEDGLGGSAAESFARACRESTGGNPLLVQQLIRSLEEDGIEPTDASTSVVRAQGPSTISRATFLRLGRLSEAAIAIARAVALLGAGAQLPHTAKLAGVSEDAVAATIDSLVRAEILTPGTTLDFVHPIVREAIYRDMPEVGRSRGHVAAARILANSGAPPELVAAQLLAADPSADEWVATTLHRLAQEALARGSAAAAAQYLRRALAEPIPLADSGSALLSLGYAEMIAGDREAEGHLRAAIEELEDPRARIEAMYMLGRALGIAGEGDEALEWWERAVKEAATFDRALADDLDAEVIAGGLMWPGRMEASRRRLAEVEPGLVGDSPYRCFLLGALAHSAVLDNRPRERVADLARRALDTGVLAEQMGAGPPGPGARHSFVAFMQAGWALIFADEFDFAEDRALHALEVARRRASPVDFAGASLLLALIEYRRGSLWEAESYARDALGTSAEHAVQMLLPVTAAVLVDALVARGALDAADALLDSHDLQGEAIGHSTFTTPYMSRCLLRLEQRRFHDGLEDVEEMGRREIALAGPNTARHAWRSTAALAHLMLGNRDQATELARRELELAQQFGARRQIGIALRAMGLVTGGSDGIEFLRTSVETLERSPARLDLARSLTELGAALRRGKRRSESRAPLRQALELAHACGATAIEQQARQELLATGARPRRIQLSGAESLTASERRVAEMAAEGMTNREIAQAQFVSTRTVETHLGHVYSKLGVSSRRELAPALAGGSAAS
jgi:DNA-binding CsgD family transcriptional regulator